MNQRLSVVIITRDEEADLPACLESVRTLAKEIVIVDSGSTDRTLEIARRYTPNIHRKEFSDYTSQKQYAVDLSTGEWILSVDADERVTRELADEIENLLAGHPPHAGYILPFEIYFMNRPLRYGGLGGEEHLRLFSRRAGRFAGGRLHEGVEVQGSIGKLNGAIRHIPYRDVNDYLDKLVRYTTLAAEKRWARGGKFSPLHHLLPVWEFFTRIVLRLGILDGTAGIAWAGLSSFHTWIKYLKLREMERIL